jgi:cation diffusion facilitator family transporter
MRWAWVSWLASILVLVIKLGAWWVTRSAVLLADAAESGLDLITASMLVLAVRISARPPDAGHPWGHGKVEYFSAGVQGALIVGTGLSIIIRSAYELNLGHVPESLEVGLGLSLLATAVNLVLALSLIRAGRRLHSPALESDGRHNLTDVVTTLGGYLGLGLAVWTGYWFLDPLAAILVSLNILYVGAGILRASVAGLMDASLDEEELEIIRSTIHEHMGKALEFHDLRTRRSSGRAFAEFHLIVSGDTSVAEAHELCDLIERALEASIEGLQVTIHVEPESEMQTLAPE